MSHGRRRIAAVLAAGALSIATGAVSVTAAAALPGSLDPSFGHKGVVKLAADSPGNNTDDEVAVDPEGRIVVLTRSDADTSALLRLTASGSLDPGFGGGGTVALPGGPWEGLALAPGGKILVGGETAEGLTLARFAADGSPDPGFGGDGSVSLKLPSPFPRGEPGELTQRFFQIAVRPDGGIVALGGVGRRAEAGVRLLGVLAAYQENGDADISFGEAGRVLLPLPEAIPPPDFYQRFDHLALRGDGRILAGGDLHGRLAVLGFRPDGSLDPSWDGDGIVTSKIETYEPDSGIGGSIGTVADLLPLADGRLIVVGEVNLLSLLPDGSVDPGFGTGEGHIHTSEGPFGETVEFSDGLVDPHGNLVLAGELRERTAIVRATATGRFDPRFAGDGMAALDLSETRLPLRAAEGATGIALLPGGNVLSAGFAYAGKQSQLALAALRNEEGELASCQGQPVLLQGTPGPDRLVGKGPIAGLGGDDFIRSEGGPVCAGPGDDVVRFDPRATVGWLSGGPGADLLIAGETSDDLFGGPGPDRLLGGPGNDVLRGGPGDDLLRGGSGVDFPLGGPGRDRVRDGRFGPPGRIYAMRRPDLRLELVVRKRRIVAVSVRATQACEELGRFESSFGDEEFGIPIRPDGRFRYEDSYAHGDGRGETVLAGRVTPRTVTGLYRQSEEGIHDSCTTGSRRKPTLRFTAGRARE